MLWGAFRALTTIVEANHQAVDASLKGQCVQMTVTLLEVKPHATANTHALHFLARLFRCSPSSSLQQLGLAFLEAGGPETLVRYLRAEQDHRNMALMAVLVMTKSISDCVVQSCYLDVASLVHVRSQFEQYAAMELSSLCEECSPNADEHQVSKLELQDYFEAAFHRRPVWAIEQVCTILRQQFT